MMRVAVRLSLALLLVLGGCRPGLPFAERLFFSQEPGALPAAADCERCHQAVVVEWQESAHARAFTSEAFQRATHGERAEACTSCHAPAPLPASGRPTLRSARREEGVTCITCHLATGPGIAPLTMRGPASRSLPVEVHPVIAEDPSYRSSELCGGCHEATFSEWERAPTLPGDEKETCQGCHMPAVYRTVESVNPDVPYSPLFVALEEAQKLRRHRFAVPGDAEDDIALSIEREATLLRVRVENRLPHALPTGSFGRREVTLLVDWPGGSAQHAVAARPGQSLASGAARTFEIPLLPDAQNAALTVSLRRFDPAQANWQQLVRASSPPLR
jgi:hypothetical protein